MAQVWTAMKYKDEVTQLQKNLEMQVKIVEDMMLRSAADKIHISDIRTELNKIHDINERIRYFVGLER
tara:strand:+ start:2014 stop:2217 length:204 start_codon:yes stop_codon:yes gene_type:complete